MVNNTFHKCTQGVAITCSYGTECCTCPSSAGDEDNKTRNTSAAVMNNVMLNMLDEDGTGTTESHVRACSGPPTISEFTLTDGELGFGHNLHYGAYRNFLIPSGPHPDGYPSVEDLQLDELTEYGEKSFGDNVEEDNPHLDDPARLSFDQTVDSPAFMSTNGVRDKAYDEFDEAFSEFPHIYRDIDGNTYSGETCALGAYKKE